MQDVWRLLRVELRKGGDKLHTLWVITTRFGNPRRVVSTEPPPDLIRHEIPVERLRREINHLVKEHLPTASNEGVLALSPNG